MIRVLIADDERLIREGLRQLLQHADDLQIVAEAADGEAALAELDVHQVDVIALDIRMPRMDGLQVLDHLRARPERPACLVLTTFDDAELLIEAARRGAQGFVSKDISLEELLTAIRAIAVGASWFQPALTSNLRQAFERHRNGEIARDSEALTERELTVLRLMAGGLTNREISQALHTAEGTVKNQVSSILSKMRVRDRTLAVLTAIESGLV